MQLHEKIPNNVNLSHDKRLLRALARNMNFSSGVMVLLLRIFFGTIALVMGFAMVTVVVERARLLAMIRQLRE